MNVSTAGRIPLKVWTDDLEEGAAEQAAHLAELPFAFHHVALMPDAHQGYGMPIGGVLATEGVVVPNAVGLDIGCGMRTWPTGVSVAEFMPHRDAVMHQIQRDVPTGFAHHQKMQAEWWVTDGVEDAMAHPIVCREYESSLHQVGTLGGGNHFIEAQADESGDVWMMLHSGSRNLGKQVADHYNRLAVALNAQWHSSVPASWELAFLPLDSDAGRSYVAEMDLCLLFARTNRERMEARIRSVLDAVFPVAAPGESLDVHHNYAAMEHHFGRNVMVHRKGAVRAREGERVIIPGSMGSSSYIALGKGEPQSFASCSHGAGRAMGRKAAKRAIPAQQVIEEMRAADIALFKAKRGDVAEECRQAYKDIDAVMAAQSDLVTVAVRLRPLAVVKA